LRRFHRDKTVQFRSILLKNSPGDASSDNLHSIGLRDRPVVTKRPDAGLAPSGFRLAKRALAFAKIVNDGDEEGAFVMHRLPTADEAGLIRRYCGIPKRREVTEAELDRLRSVGFAASRAA